MTAPAQSPIVSLRLATAAGQPGVAETEQSLAAQTFPAWEWVCDGAAPRAPFVMELAGGDRLEPTALEKLVWCLTSYPEYQAVAAGPAPGVPVLRRNGAPAVGARLRETLAHPGTVGARSVGEWREEKPRWHQPYDIVPDEVPFSYRLPKKRPRVLLVVPWLTMGGSDKFNLDLVEQLVTQQGYDVTIAATGSGDNARAPLFAPFTPEIFILENFLRLVDYPRFLRHLIESRQADAVLISHSQLGYRLLPYLRAYCPAPVYADYCHLEEEQWQNGGYPRASLNFQAFLDRQIVSSHHLKKWLVTRGGAAERIEVCYTNIDPQRWRPDASVRARVRQEYGLTAAVPVILFAGRLCEQKQPRVLAEALGALRRAEWQALIAGDGEDRAWLEGYFREHGLTKRVQLLGATPYSRVGELMCASDIFFLPSQREGIALSLFEAMATGLVVVGADVGGQCELVTPDCGVLLTQATAADYSRVLAELLAAPARRAAFGQQARQRIVERFPLAAMGRRMAEWLGSAGDLPRLEAPGRAVGLACATEAIEHTRLAGVADWLWKKQNEPNR